MKFIPFNLMPYRDLPENFDEKYDSVWVDIPRDLFDPENGHQHYHDYLDELELAIELGYDGVGVNEHHGNAYGMMASPNLFGAILSRSIPESNCSLMVLGNSLALYNPPIRVAEEFATLDVLTDGQLITGFPAGTPMDTSYLYGINPVELRDMWDEAYDLILKAWDTDEPFEYNGKYTQIKWVNAWPAPRQRPHPPIWIPGGGSLETIDFALNHDHNYSYLSFNGYRHAEEIYDAFWQRTEELGQDPNPYRAAFAQFILVAESDAKAQELYQEHVEYFYNYCLHIKPGFFDAPGHSSPRSTRAKLRDQLTETAKIGREALQEGMSWEEFLDNGYVIAGSPETVRDRIIDLADTLNLGNILMLQQIGSMPHELCMRNTRIFAEEVMPHVKDKFSEYDPSPYWPSEVRHETVEPEKEPAPAE